MYIPRAPPLSASDRALQLRVTSSKRTYIRETLTARQDVPNRRFTHIDQGAPSRLLHNSSVVREGCILGKVLCVHIHTHPSERRSSASVGTVVSLTTPVENSYYTVGRSGLSYDEVFIPQRGCEGFCELGKHARTLLGTGRVCQCSPHQPQQVLVVLPAFGIHLRNAPPSRSPPPQSASLFCKQLVRWERHSQEAVDEGNRRTLVSCKPIKVFPPNGLPSLCTRVRALPSQWKLLLLYVHEPSMVDRLKSAA
jgi:hypothetical protein